MSNQTEWWAPVRSDDGAAELFGGERATPDAGAPRRRSRASGRKREERLRKQRRRRSVGVMAVALVLLVGAGYVVYSLLGDSLFGGGTGGERAVSDYPGPGRPGAPTVTVNPGDSGAAMGKTLADAGIVATVEAFTAAYNANADASSIQPGTYQLLLEMKAEDAVRALLDPKSRVSMRVTIPESFTAEQVYDKISQVTLVSVDELKAVAADPAAIGLPAEANGNVEGWLFPSTYQYEPDTTPADMLRPMIAKTVEVLTSKGVPQDQWETVLIKASLIEREGRLDEDRPKMARVIENRLARDMRLQIDASLAYGLGISGTQLTLDMLNTSDSPYNLNRFTGLPPTPISGAGLPSIDAVLNPADGPWLFWMLVNGDTGETRFATTNDEHEQNRALYRQWQAEKAAQQQDEQQDDGQDG
ncbi:aminodeoxychorismate lyase [Cellulomonas sp. B6]|nr:aminodeoxychorismate lyase [Cellulomonas sp. B6]